MTLFLNIMVMILGMCFGSFINMLTYRTAVSYELLKRKFKVKDDKRSFCDGCGKELPWYDNIPVASWIILRGKTRCCNKKLPVAYPIVELATGIFFLFLWWTGNWQIRVLSVMKIQDWMVMGLVLVVAVLVMFAVVFDLYYMVLPDFSTLILILAATLLVIVQKQNLYEHVFSALGAGGFLGGLYWFTKGKGIGFGDVKWALFMGMLLGGWNTLVAFYSAFIIGAVVGVGLMAAGKAGGKTAIPFGPFLALGTIIAWSWGTIVIDFFKTWFF